MSKSRGGGGVTAGLTDDLETKGGRGGGWVPVTAG